MPWKNHQSPGTSGPSKLKFLYHLMEPFLGIMLDQVPRPTHSKLRVTLQNLYKQMTVPIPGMSFSGLERHTLPALADGFSQQKYKDLWLESFQRHLQKYDADKVESAIKIVMKQLASTLFKQRGVQNEFGPEYEEYTAKKQAGTVESEEQLDTIPIDNKVGENYFGQLTDQL